MTFPTEDQDTLTVCEHLLSPSLLPSSTSLAIDAFKSKVDLSRRIKGNHITWGIFLTVCPLLYQRRDPAVLSKNICYAERTPWTPTKELSYGGKNKTATRLSLQKGCQPWRDQDS